MSNVYTPVVDADALYGEGDWRPLLGEGPRKAEYKLYMIGKQSIEHRLKGIILPAYDWTLSIDDQSFAESVGPCWSAKADKRLGRHFVPNAFALPLFVYPFMGERKEHWMSPSNLSTMIGGDKIEPEDAADAFDDLNKWIRRNKAFNEAKRDFFLKAPSMKEDALVPGRSVRFFALARCYDKDNTWHNAVVGYTSSAQSYLIDQMRWQHQAQDGPPRDPDWPQYMLGDPTSPGAAIQWHVDKVQLDAKDTHDTNVICFTERAEFLDADQKVRKITRDELANRFMMPDPKNWNIPTYEEQVEHMIHHFDGAITMDMIRGACAYRFRGELPKERPSHIVTAGGGAAEETSPDADEDYGDARRSRTSRQVDDSDPMAAVTGGGRASRLAPDSEAPLPRRESTAPPRSEPAPTATAAPTAASPTASYWTGSTGNKPVKQTVAELQALADSGSYDGVKVMVGTNLWKTLEECGLVTIRPPVVVEEEAPSFPDDTPPPVPGDDNPKEGQISRDAMKLRLFPDASSFNSLTPAQQKSAEELVDRAWEGTGYGVNSELPDDVVDGLLQLV